VSTLWRRVVLVTILAIVVFAAFSMYADVDALRTDLARLSPLAVLAALGLAFANYLIRFVRWEAYLRAVGIRAPRRISLLVFFSGFVMSVTPGKIGEIFKAVLLRDSAGAERAPLARTMPVVVAERVTDLISVVILGIAGAAAFREAIGLVVAAAAVTASGVLVVSIRPLAHGTINLFARIPRIGRLAPKLREMHDHLSTLIRPAPLSWATGLGIAAWLCECVGFALILGGFPGTHVSLPLATFIYAATTVAGALSFLPGGLGVTEAGMTFMLVRHVGKPTAVAATIVTRLCTMWFAVVLGLFALFLLRRVRPSISLATIAKPEPEGPPK
jgi:glycosyltransferase 2 family protein